MQPPKIETNRLLLTWPNKDQIDQYYKDIINTNMFDTIQWDGPTTPEDIHSYWHENRGKDISDLNNNLTVALIEKESKAYIGGADLRIINDNHTQIDIGYTLAPKFHGKDYATEAVKFLVNEAFKNREAKKSLQMSLSATKHQKES